MTRTEDVPDGSEPRTDGGTGPRPDGGRAEASPLDALGETSDAEVEHARRKKLYNLYRYYVYTPVSVLWHDWRARVGLSLLVFYFGMGLFGPMVVDETGETVAEGPPRHESKAAAKRAAEEMRETFPEARTDKVGRGAFQVYERTEDGAAWHWRFISADGAILARAAEGETTRDRAVDAIETVRTEAPDAAQAIIDSFAFVLGRDDGEWSWRLVDRGRTQIAAGAPWADRAVARETVEEIRSAAADADVFELTGPVFRVALTDDAWTWTLVDAAWTPLADAADTWPDRDAAAEAAERVGALAPDAGELSYEDAAFELFEDEAGWRWRFIDEAERELAESPVGYPDREAARATVDRLRGVVPDASVLEIETASFELYEAADASGWKFRLVDRDGDTVARSVQTYDSRTAAREGMGTLKDRAPDAGVVVAG